MGFCYTKRIVVDPKQVSILGENDERFWLHHGRRPEEKENLRHLAQILPDAIDKYQTGQTLTEEEDIAYSIFVKEGPKLEYDCVHQCFNVIDGRHRMFMLREEGIQLEMQVGCYDIPQYEKDRLKEQEELTAKPQQQAEGHKNYFLELFSTIKECFEAITDRGSVEHNELANVHTEIDEKETIVTKMAIVDNELNRSLVGILDANVYQTNDEQHLIIEGQNLDGAQDLFQDEVVILEEREL